MGAGTANLSILLAQKGLQVLALEPNMAMRQLGVRRTQRNQNITWANMTAEDTRLKSDAYDMVSFGSSFNVVDRSAALLESLRISKPAAWFMAIWNHRDLDDPLQQRIEACIKGNITDYDYGSRRQDQNDFLLQSGLFSQVNYFESRMRVKQHIDDVREAWHSHATLQRQAGKYFITVIKQIDEILRRQGSETLEIPYTSRAWVARFRA